MELIEAAKLIGAGLAVIGMIGSGIGIGNVFSSFIIAVGRNPAARGEVFTMTMLGFALGSFAFGKAMDRFGVGKVLIGAAMLIGAGFLIGTFANSLALLSLTQFAVGLGTGTCSSAWRKASWILF